jgi:hypothetical protein
MLCQRQRVKLAFTDFPGPFNPTRIQRLLERRFDVELSENPDYVVFSVFGFDHLKYDGAVKIFYRRMYLAGF